MLRSVLILIAGIGILFLFLVAGVLVYNNNNGCTTINDCASTQYCNINGLCTDFIKCNDNRQCPSDQTCTGSICLPKLSCQSSTDCPLSTLCENGKCLSILSCNNSNDCEKLGTSTNCIEGVCKQKYCDVNKDCKFDEICLNNFCALKDEIICHTDKDCPSSDLFCSNNICVQCTNDEHCSDGQYCTNNKCKSCMSNNECNHNEHCIHTEKDNYCCSNDDLTLNKICTSNKDCGDINSYCVNGSCRCKPASLYPTTEQCSSSNDCPSNSFCAKSYKGNYCLTNGSHCLFHYTHDHDNNILSCSSDFPYCTLNPQDNVFRCSKSYINSICLDDNCEDGLNCVNNTCLKRKGIYGEKCIHHDDCDSSLKCKSGICTTK